jgi:hypothetical protein
MSGFIQSGAMAAVGSGVVAPTISGVTLGNALVCCYTTDDNATLVAPTDSAGQTWALLAQFGVGGSTLQTVAIAYLLNANAGAHNLSWATQSLSSVARISEWNGITTVTGAGTPATASMGASGTSLTSGSYTPGSASEVVFAVFNEEGSVSNEGVKCNTAAFQVLGTASDAGSNPCLLIEQSGLSFLGAEANAAIVSSATPLTVNWTWTNAQFGLCLVAGMPLSGATPPPPSYALSSDEYF